jgi:hypothetical protein
VGLRAAPDLRRSNHNRVFVAAVLAIVYFVRDQVSGKSGGSTLPQTTFSPPAKWICPVAKLFLCGLCANNRYSTEDLLPTPGGMIPARDASIIHCPVVTL